MALSIVRRPAILLFAWVTFGCSVPGEDPKPTKTEPGEPPASTEAPGADPLAGKAAEIVTIRGPGGLTSSSLAAGMMLGPGAAVAPGQDLRTGTGTLAEVRVAGGRLRMNEDTRIELPREAEGALTLHEGALVVLPDVGARLEILAGSERVRARQGEIEVRVDGDTRHFAVVHGEAEVNVSGQTKYLAAGESLDTPLPADVPAAEVIPVASLAPLRDTGWARSFEEAARKADALPPGVGSLTARRAGTSTEFQHLGLVEHRVNVSISGRVAYTEVEQAFHNDRSEVLEGIYRFPMPTDASLSDLWLLVGNDWVQGAVVEKTRGRQIFNAIVDATVPRDPALLEWQRGNLFQLRIFPIPGHQQRRVKLSYTQVLPVVGGTLRYRYPLGGSGAAGTPMERFAFSVRVDGRELTREQLEAIEMPMLPLERKDEGGHAVLQTTQTHFLPAFDVGVDIPIQAKAERVESSTYRDKDGQAYFMVSMQPEFSGSGASRPTDYAFVLDRSHGTPAESWAASRGIFAAMAEMLGRDDRFTVLACDTACDEVQGGITSVSPEAFTRAETFLNGQALAGASDLGGMLEEARKAIPQRPDARKVVVYLGDGEPTSGELTPAGLTQALAGWSDTRVMAVAMGARADLTTLGAVVRATGGDLVQADPRDDAATLVRELRLRTVVPALEHPTFELPAGMTEVREQTGPSLHAGDAMVLVGKLQHAVSGDIRLRGQGPKGPLEETFRVDLDPAAKGSDPVAQHLPRTWAALELEHLTRTRGDAARAEVVALSTRYNVLSRHTALLVLENDAMFREFNVARRAEEKDAWDGSLPDLELAADEETSDAVGRSAAGSPAAGASSQGGLGARARNDVMAEPEPAPAAAPMADRDEARREKSSAPKPASPAESSSRTPPIFVPPPNKKKSGDDDFYTPGLPPSDPAAWWTQRHPVRRIVVRPNSGAISQRSMQRVEALEQAVLSQPTSRAARGRLVRTAIALGHPRALEFARAWAEVDPDHGPALTAFADALAAEGDPLALRGYASVVDSNPFSESAHERLAAAYEGKGDLRRACSHRRALVSIDPKDASYLQGLAVCSRGALASTPSLGSGDLKAELTWSGAGDLDIAIIDGQGRRLSALRPEGVRVREAAGSEQLTLRSVRSSVTVAVTRNSDKAEAAASLPAVLKLKTPHGTRTFTVELGRGSTRVAKVAWDTQFEYR